jgi:hypothetical protein
MNALEKGVARKERPAEEGVGRRQDDRRLEAGKASSLYLVDLFSLLLFFKRCRRVKQGKNGRGLIKGITRASAAPFCVFWDDFDNILLTMTGVAKAGSSCTKGPLQ